MQFLYMNEFTVYETSSTQHLEPQNALNLVKIKFGTTYLHFTHPHLCVSAMQLNLGVAFMNTGVFTNH